MAQVDFYDGMGVGIVFHARVTDNLYRRDVSWVQTTQFAIVSQPPIADIHLCATSAEYRVASIAAWYGGQLGYDLVGVAKITQRRPLDVHYKVGAVGLIDFMVTFDDNFL